MDGSGYYVELVDGAEFVGQRMKIALIDVRRSFAVAGVILSGQAVIR